ncbi:MAG: hypothetical protein LBC40_02970 [Dysgonamonadaceae bacterium]|jgi:hypothetical protein|nr:hypothetical protein [Dysgonamonadaceae bacterium]
MKKDVLYSNLLQEIRRKVPHSPKLTNVLVKLLMMEKEAVYRRLRGDVPFTFHEIAIVAKEFGLSLNNIVGIDSEKSRPFQLKINDYTYPDEVDYKMFEDEIEMLRLAKNDDSSMAEASNILPQSLVMDFNYIAKFYFFKWDYHQNERNQMKSFGEFNIPDRILKLQRDLNQEIKNIKYSFYVWDHFIFQYLVNDIKYLAEMYLLTPEDLLLLKDDLYQFLEYAENIAIKGVYPDTRNKVHLYISDVNIETNYSYIKTHNQQISKIRSFVLNSLVSHDPRSFEHVKSWINSLKRTSTLISVSGEKQRMQFFEKQREIINSL